ncbi:MAG: NAD(P)-dependent oxidoreductase [Selenomonadaceae bacterium]|nr:NAD(P)-dependent oxidoreductase [Selenomonadaceae bacterium]
MKKIIINGATSFVGVHLIEEWLKEKDVEIFAVVRPNSSNITRLPCGDKVHIIEREMEEYDKLSNDIKKADYFYHLSWEGARSPHRDDKAIQSKNYICAIKAFDSAVKMGCSFFLGSGSQAEYGLTNGVVDEQYPCNPNTEYGKEKLHTYYELKRKAKEHNMHFIWTRIFSIYGKYDYAGTLVMSCISKMKNNEPIDMTPGTQMWDYLNVKDAARAMKMFPLTECENGVYNVASGEYKQLRWFVEAIKDVMKSSSELNFGIIPFGINGPVNLMPDVDKIMKTLNWKPNVSFNEGIAELL